MTTALLLVDVQRNMLEGNVPVPAAQAARDAIESLLARARTARALVVHVQNDGAAGDPDVPFTTGWELVFEPQTGEIVVRKQVQDTFAANPDLAPALRARGVDQVIVAGMQSEFCITATSRAAHRLGFGAVLAAGAHATYDGREPAAAISARVESELRAEGVRIEAAETIRFS